MTKNSAKTHFHSRSDGQNVHAVILAAGRGLRLAKESAHPKQFRHLGDKPLYQWSLQRFLQMPMIEHVHLVAPSADIASIERELDLDTQPLCLVEGGNSRIHSALNGLNSVKSKCPTSDPIVLIHDAARPFVTEDIVQDLIHNLGKFDGAVPGLAVTDTIKLVDANLVQSTLPRNQLIAVQTPQAFRLSKLIDANAKIDPEDPTLTDDASIMEAAGAKIAWVKGDPKLMKITSPGDFERAIAFIDPEI